VAALQNKQRWSWLALRTARDNHLQHFGKIGAGDVILLAQEIEKENKEREEQKKAPKTDSQEGSQSLSGQSGATGMDDCGPSPPLPAPEKGKDDEKGVGVEENKPVDGEGDVQMDSEK
jgi:hypothetical protein